MSAAPRPSLRGGFYSERRNPALAREPLRTPRTPDLKSESGAPIRARALIKERKENKVLTEGRKNYVIILISSFDLTSCSFPLFLLRKERFQRFLEFLKLR